MSGPNFITTALSWLLSRPLAIVLLISLVIAAMLGGVNSCYSRRYDKQRAEYEEQSRVRVSRIDQLEGENVELRKQIADLEPKALAYTAIVDSKIKVDEALKDKIEKVTEDAANAESSANASVSCRTRADRLCALFRTGDARFDCSIIFAECGQ